MCSQLVQVLIRKVIGCLAEHRPLHSCQNQRIISWIRITNEYFMQLVENYETIKGGLLDSFCIINWQFMFLIGPHWLLLAPIGSPLAPPRPYWPPWVWVGYDRWGAAHR